MSDPDGTLSERTLEEIALMSGIRIPEDEYDDQLERLRERLEATRAWDERDLGFSFEDGGFEYVPPAHLHRHRWDVPTPMNGQRAATRDANDDGTTDE